MALAMGAVWLILGLAMLCIRPRRMSAGQNGFKYGPAFFFLTMGVVYLCRYYGHVDNVGVMILSVGALLLLSATLWQAVKT